MKVLGYQTLKHSLAEVTVNESSHRQLPRYATLARNA